MYVLFAVAWWADCMGAEVGAVCAPWCALHRSAYYKTHARDPANTELAWWVAQRYEKVAARLKRQEIAAVGRGARTGRLGDGSSADDEDLSNPELTEAE